MPETRDFTIYGDWIEPTRGQNFIVLRVPAGRIPWRKKIRPEIDKLVRSFYEATDDPRFRRLNRDVVWSNEQLDEPNTVWECGKYARYEWTPENGFRAVKENT